MCGFAGYVDFARPPQANSLLLRMAASLRHRGPDDTGVMINGACGLAHARLSIIDVAHSVQPMRSRCGRFALAYNGELYNYPELRDELLSSGAQFETSGDTEVLLQSLQRRWIETLPGLDGMFGFAIWDAREQRLLLARDPIGEKPLFYANPAPGLLVFGSEIKALLEHPDVEAQLNVDTLRQVLRFRASYGAETLYQDVRQLEPGHWLEFTSSGLRIGCYYDLAKRTAAATERLALMSSDEVIRHGEELLTRSVRRRLLADVPVGAFLSGGLDSSLIVALMRSLRQDHETVRTFSVGFAHDQHSELPFAAMVADRLGTNHTEVHVDPATYASELAHMSTFRDAPISEPADIAIARMSRVAKETVKVVLSGEGADEVFGGYPKYRFANVPRVLRAAMRGIGDQRAAWAAGLCGINRRRALVAARALSHRDELSRLTQWFSYLSRPDLIALLPGLGWEQIEWDRTVDSQQDALRRAVGDSPVRRMQVVDCLTWLPGNLLERGDRMTMAAGLELRLPFLDIELTPYGLALPDRFKVSRRSLKWIVRKWAAKHLPKTILHKKKWGFRVPLAQWFRGSLRSMLFEHLTNPQGICGTFGDRAQITALLESHDRGDVDANLTLWSLLTAEVWYQNVFRARSANHPVPAAG
jgi:asparagine synthase (glutamine-hydrolysing)